MKKQHSDQKMSLSMPLSTGSSMPQAMHKSRYAVLALCSVALLLGACQKQSDPDQASTQTQTAVGTVALIQANVVAVEGAKKQFCDESECTNYDLQTVQTNLPWIDAYFLKRIKTDLPNAFTTTAATPAASQPASQATAASDIATSASAVPASQAAELKTEHPMGIGESLVHVRYLGQNYNLASFEMSTYIYAAGAAHGMSHNEYVHFDLKNQKKIALSDLLKPNVEAKLIQQLYEENSTWLQDHQIEAAKLQLSDNYYYGVNGIVFVYPLYELASYAEGMPELTLSYIDAEKFVKAEYLPSLPKIATP